MELINTTAADGQRYCRTLSYDADSCPCNDHQKRLGTGFSCDRSDVQITARADIGSGPESAATTVAARKLLDILRAVPAGEVQISVADQRLTIQAGKSRFALQTLDAGDFPTVAQAQTFDLSVQITQKAFKALLGCT